MCGVVSVPPLAPRFLTALLPPGLARGKSPWLESPQPLPLGAVAGGPASCGMSVLWTALPSLLSVRVNALQACHVGDLVQRKVQLGRGRCWRW